MADVAPVPFLPSKSFLVLQLEDFMCTLEAIRHDVRWQLRVIDERSAEVYALTVFLCDGLLALKPAPQLHPLIKALAVPTAAARATRFFEMASNLPMELQMLLCHRVVGSMKQNVLHEESEAAFKALANSLLFC